MARRNMTPDLFGQHDDQPEVHQQAKPPDGSPIVRPPSSIRSKPTSSAIVRQWCGSQVYVLIGFAQLILHGPHHFILERLPRFDR